MLKCQTAENSQSSTYFNPVPYIGAANVLGLVIMFVVIYRKLIFPPKS